MPDIKDLIDYVIKKHETMSTNSPIHIYIKRINYRMKTLELQTPETLFGSTKKEKKEKMYQIL